MTTNYLARKISQFSETISLWSRNRKPIEKRDYNDIPRLLTYGKYVVIRDTPVGLNDGLYIEPIRKLTKECTQYENETFLERRDNGKRASTKEIIETMLLEAERGTLLDILVERRIGEPTAEQIAIRIYAGITTKSNLPDFDRFCKKSTAKN